MVTEVQGSQFVQKLERRLNDRVKTQVHHEVYDAFAALDRLMAEAVRWQGRNSFTMDGSETQADKDMKTIHEILERLVATRQEQEMSKAVSAVIDGLAKFASEA